MRDINWPHYFISFHVRSRKNGWNFGGSVHVSSVKVCATSTMARPSLVQYHPQIPSRQPFSLIILISWESVKLKGLVNPAFVEATPKSALKRHGFHVEKITFCDTFEHRERFVYIDLVVLPRIPRVALSFSVRWILMCKHNMYCSCIIFYLLADLHSKLFSITFFLVLCCSSAYSPVLT